MLVLWVSRRQRTLVALKEVLSEAKRKEDALQSQIAKLAEREMVLRNLWKLNCIQLTDYDNALPEKEDENGQLKARLTNTDRPLISRETPKDPADENALGTGLELHPVEGEDPTSGDIHW